MEDVFGTFLAMFATLWVRDQVRKNGGVPPSVWWGLKRLIKFVAIGWLVIATLAILGGMISWAVAQTTQRTYQDSMGRNLGRSVTDGRNTAFYDSMGRTTGRSVTTGGNTTIYNPLGQQTGTIRSK